MISRPNAILILNPPNADQGFLVPQLSTSNRLAILPTSPTDNGLVVFDITEQSFYYWSNGLWIKGLGSSTGEQTSGITNINTGNGLTGGPITNTGTISILNGGVNTSQIANDAVTTNKILDGAVTAIKINPSATNGHVLTTVAGATTWQPPSAVLTGVASGDLSGSYPAPTVTKLQGIDVSTTDPTNLQVLQYVGTAWTPVTLPGISASVAFKVQQTGVQEIDDDDEIQLNWGNELYDDNNNFSSNRFQAPSTGLYHFDVLVSLMDVDRDEHFELILKVGPNDIQRVLGPSGEDNGGGPVSAQISTDVKLNVGNLVTVWVELQNSTSTLPGVRTQFSGRRIY